jgi:6-phosphogluconate dehydrogenase
MPEILPRHINMLHVSLAQLHLQAKASASPVLTLSRGILLQLSSQDLAERDAAWRRVVALAVTNGVPAPGMMASLSYFDTYRRERLPANMVQVRC